MKSKNHIAIVTAVTLILIGSIITGIILQNFGIIWFSFGILVAGALGISVYRISKLAIEVKADKLKDTNKDSENNQENGESKDKSLNKTIANVKPWLYSPAGEAVKCTMFIITFLISCILFIVLCSEGYFEFGILAWAIGVFLIVGAIIAMAVIERLALKKAKEEKMLQNPIENIENENNQIEMTEEEANTLTEEVNSVNE